MRVLTERSSKIFECVKNFGTSAFIDIDASDDMHQIVNQYKEEIKGSYYSGILTGFRGAVTTDVYGYSQLEIMPQYLHSANDEAIVDEFVNRTANEIMSSCHTEADRIKAAHDAITANAKYFDCENMSHSPVSIVENGTGVCQAYSLLNQKLLEAMGINSQYVVGTAINEGEHAWNMVECDSNWYHVDTTWDDCTETYDYYMVDSNQMANTHSWDSAVYTN